jgi:hypothetical protein
MNQTCGHSQAALAGKEYEQQKKLGNDKAFFLVFLV